MMRRAWLVWTLFAGCLAVVLATLGWLTHTIVRLDRAQAEARAQAAIEESVRLALWRIDSAVAPLIARESARPYFVYSALYPAMRAYGNMFNTGATPEALVPSPLLTESTPRVRLHFQLEVDADALTSPQVPAPWQRTEALLRLVHRTQFGDAEERLAQLRTRLDANAATRLAALPRAALPEPAVLVPADRAVSGAFPPPRQTVQTPNAQVAPPLDHAQRGSEQALRNTQEQQARLRSVQQQVQTNEVLPGGGEAELGAAGVTEGPLTPLWIGDALLLARRITVQGREYVQGCWLDWPSLSAWLCGEVVDLFPNARLEPSGDPAAAPAGRELASLPARLVPGSPALAPAAVASPLRASLWIAWLCVVLAAAAVAFLLSGTVALSERRAAFVSAVTHELRTPLTTFRLYTEMLTEGMVPEGTQRQSYLATLQAEASRLCHLVDNVLSYARIERGRTARQLEYTSLCELLARSEPRLTERALQAGLTLNCAAAPASGKICVRADPGAVEQILFNLVDNTCKYAADGDPRSIDIEHDTVGGFGCIRVRDHGPGISPVEARRLFQPFRKSAREAANSAPGVGLGLALSRRLARAMGGDLRLAASAGGACFELFLKTINRKDAKSAKVAKETGQ